MPSQTKPNTFYRDPVRFIDTVIQKNELGQPFKLADHQRTILRLAFAFDDDGRLPWDTILWSCLKKSGKTTINAALTIFWGFAQEPPNEILICANDLEQSIGRVFAACAGMIRNNPMLAAEADVGNRVITLSNGTTITALASEYQGASGSNHGLVSYDELWGYTSERSRRLFEELTSVPTRLNSIRFISTYAGYEGESNLLWELYKQAVAPDEYPDAQGERLHKNLPCYGNREARIFAYWDHVARMPWQTEAYYASQKKTLRPNTFLRLHGNQWSTGESKFIDGALWDQCVDSTHVQAFGARRDIFVGVDAGIKHDSAAVIAVAWNADDKIEIVHHRIWKPSFLQPLDIEATIESELRDLSINHALKEILCDPYQLHRSITTLANAGLPIRELPQTPANCTAFGQALFDALNSKTLRIYPSDDLRAQALNTIAVENPRGWRIAKEKTSKKIDAIVALAMAIFAATGKGPFHFQMPTAHGERTAYESSAGQQSYSRGVYLN